MRRIGACQWTYRPPKGTSRAKRAEDRRTFRLAAAIINGQMEVLKPTMARAIDDLIFFGHAVVRVAWDGTDVRATNATQEDLDESR